MWLVGPRMIHRPWPANFRHPLTIARRRASQRLEREELTISSMDEYTFIDENAWITPASVV